VQVQAKLDAATADALASKVAAALRALPAVPRQVEALDVGKEPALAPDASLPAVQKRIRCVRVCMCV